MQGRLVGGERGRAGEGEDAARRIVAADDAALVEAAGGRVVLVAGPADNVKVTSPLDLVVAAALASVSPP